jgi:HTH-type transcriptional regulator / antitoxin HipB
MKVRTPNDMAMMVRDARAGSGLSQARLAERIGVSRAWVVKLEKGQPRIELGLVLRALEGVGLVMTVGVDTSAPPGRRGGPPGPRLPQDWRTSDWDWDWN